MNKILKSVSVSVFFYSFFSMQAYAELSSNWFITNNWGSATTSTNSQTGNTPQITTNTSSASAVNIATTTSASSQNANQSMAQNVALPAYMNIPTNVQNTINILKSRYNLNQSQVSSLTQIARSYQYVLYNKPNTKEKSNMANIRDVAATNCAESRLPETILDDVVNQIELTSLDTQDKKTVYQNYINFIDDNSNYQNTTQSCEDEYSGGNVINISDTNNNQSYNSSYPGIVSDQNIKSQCLVLTNFMEYKSKSTQVSMLQNFLMENGYLEMYPTGFYGRNTEAAAKEWQKRHSIEALGWVGPATRGSVAQITCKDQVSVNRAIKGEIYKAPIVKKVIAKKTVAKVSDKGGYVEVVKPIINIATSTTVITSTTTVIEEVVTPVFTQTLNNMSSRGGTFYTKRNPVNTLYFSYKANVSRDEVYICLEKAGQTACSDNNNYTLLKERYEPGNIDSIANGDRWIFNLYYNANLWSGSGGKIYIKNGISSISEVYTVRVVDSL